MTDKAANILYVDDEKPILEMVQMSLDKMGYTVVTADDPFAALGLFESDPMGFDLVITDVRMPRMNGDRLARKLLALRPDLPVIFCSGTIDLDLRTADEINACAYLEKPLLRAQMAEAIQNALTAG